MKHIIDLDALRTTGLPPGASLHRADGIQVNVEETDALVQNGEIVEIRQNGKRIGQLRLPNKNEPYAPNKMEAVVRMLADARREHFKSAVNWIDRDKERFWCPVCAKNQSHPAAFSCWASPEPECNPVCYYGICKRCTAEGERLQHTQKLSDEAAFRRMDDLSEERLVNRYPHIAAKLPAGYFDHSA